MIRSLAILLLAGSAAVADVVHLKSGGRLEGRVTEEGDRVRVDTGHGTLVLGRDEVDRIEKKAWSPPARAIFEKRPPRLRDRFAHPFYGFRLYLPSRWAVGAPRQPQTVSFYGPKEGAFTPRMDVGVEANRGTVANMVGLLKRAFAKRYRDVIFPLEETATIGGRDAYLFVAWYRDGDVPMRALWGVLAGDGLLYTAGFACTDAWFDRYYAALDASMRSLRLFPPPTVPLKDRKEFDRLYNEGAALASEGRLDEALGCFADASKLLPSFPDVHNVVGRLHARRTGWEEAEASFAKAHALDPHDHEFAYNLGVALHRQGKHRAAVDALEKAVQADPAMEPALTSLGRACIDADLVARAIAALKRAVLADPESAVAHSTLGLAWERSGKRREAAASFREALKIDAGHAEAQAGLARVEE